MKKSLLKCTLMLLLGVSSALVAATALTLKVIPVEGNCMPLGISANGDHVVGRVGDQENQNGFYYSVSKDSSYMMIMNSQLWDATNNGILCGAAMNNDILDMVSGYWQNNQWVTLGAGIPLGSVTHAFSESASVLVGKQTPAGDDYGARAYKWTSATGITLIGLPNSNSTAYSISSDGSTIGGWQESLEGETDWCDRNPVIWKNGVMTRLNAGPGEWICPGEVDNLSQDGTIAVGEWDAGQFIWTEAAGMTRIGTLPGDWNASALGVSDAGLAIGFSSMGMTRTATAWTAQTGLQPITDYFSSLGCPVPDGWLLQQANGISADGKTIIGFGRAPGYTTLIGWVARIEDTNDIIQTGNTNKIAQINGNYPNPFNPSTAINFTVNQVSNVKMQILNANGQLVKEAALGSLTAGSHSYSFNGESLNSGIYFCTLLVDGAKIASHKMVLTK